MENQIAPTPVYRGGQIIGVSDPITNQTRLISPVEAKLYKKIERGISEEQLLDKRKDLQQIELPEIEKQEIYSQQLGTFVYESPTGRSGTAYQRIPTISEQETLEEIQRKGTKEYLMEQVEKKIVTPTLRSAEVVTKPIRNIPIIDFNVGEEIGRVVKNPSRLKDYFWKAKPQMVLDISSSEARVPTEEEKKVLKEPKPDEDKNILTIGEATLGVREGLSFLGESSSIGWSGISGELYKKAEDEKGIKKKIFKNLGYISSGISSVTPTLTSSIPYTISPILGASTDILAIEEKKTKLDKYVMEAIGSGYQEYLKVYKKQGENLQEGYSLEPKLSKKEFEEKYGSDIVKQVESGINQEAVIPFIVLATAGGIKIAKGIKWSVTQKEIPKTRIGGETLKLEPIIKGQPVYTDQGIKEFVSFKQMYIKTPVSAYYQSPIKKLFGLEPQMRVLSRGQTYVYQPVQNLLGIPIDAGKPYLGMFGRVGKSGSLVNQRFYKVTPKTGDIIPEEIIKLPKGEQYVWKELVEKTKTGVPVRYEDISKYFPEEQTLKVGEVSIMDITKIGTGRSLLTTRADTIITPIKTFESGAGTYRIESGLKDISKPFWRASGDVDISKAVYMRYPPIDISKGTSGIDIFVGGGKKSSEQYLKDLYKIQNIIETPTIKKIPKVQIKPTTIITPTKTTKVVTPSMFTGTGLYERTEGDVTFQIGRQSIDIQPNLLQVQPQQVKRELKILPLIKQNQRNELKFLQEIKPAQRELTKLQEKQLIKELLTTGQVNEQTTFQPKIIFKTIQPQIKPVVPTISVIDIKIPIKAKEKEEILKGIDEGEFKVFVRKKKKDIEIGTFKTLREAREELFGTLRQEIRASGFLERKGKKIRTPLIGTEFKQSKVDSFRVVEPRERRIKRGTKEIFQLKEEKNKARGGFFR